MNCRECKSEMTEVRGPYNYTESGLPPVVLVDVLMRHCATCGASTVSIGRMGELHELIERLACAQSVGPCLTLCLYPGGWGIYDRVLKTQLDLAEQGMRRYERAMKVLAES